MMKDIKNKFIFRKSVASDQKQIEKLFLQMLTSVYGHENVKGYETGYLEKFYQDTGDWICVAEANHHVIGYLSIELHEEDDGFLYLDDLCVDQGYRNIGIGTTLLKKASEYACEKQIKNIFLHVERENVRAVELYRRLGYIIFSEEGTRYRMILKNC